MPSGCILREPFRFPSPATDLRMRATRLFVAGLVLAAGAPVLRAQSVDFDAATIQQLSAAMDAGTVTSERLVRLALARIEAYDEKGPRLNAVLTLNAKALEQARTLDAERKATGKRSPLHGIPVVLKDNFDTKDLPTTAGSILLEGSLPPDDAFLVKRLRDAGAVIIAKVNLSEFASGSAFSSLGGQTRNPHDPLRTPSGSSGGTGASIAAAFAVLGLGTDTGGSIRGPAAANGIAGLKPTLGLLSRDGIVPLALSFDTGGPLARHVSDLAVTLGLLTGVDAADTVTRRSEGRFDRDYTKYLDTTALRGARIGVARDFFGQDAEVDWVMEASLAAMRAAGAVTVDVRLPKWLLDAKGEFYSAVRYPEFVVQVEQYLATLAPGYPRTLADMLARSNAIVSPRADGAGPNEVRWNLFKREAASGTLSDAAYTSVRTHGLALVSAALDGVFAANRLDAIVYPTASRRPDLITAPPEPPGGGAASAANLANLAGLPDLIVPAGFTSDRLPVTMSFLGRAFTEGRLLGLGYAFEQRTKARRLPIHTPALTGEKIIVR
jgi:amidase